MLIADEGKVFMRISDGQILGERLSLGINDSARNYKQVDESFEYTPPGDAEVEDLKTAFDILTGGLTE